MDPQIGKLLENQFFSGGFVLLVLGGLAAALRSLPGRVWEAVKAKLITTVTIRNDDETFTWINWWLSKQPYSARSRRLTAFTVRGEAFGDGTGPTTTRVHLAPAPGSHWFFYRGRLLCLWRVRQEQPHSLTAAGKREEYFQLDLFSRNRQVVVDLLEEARRLAMPEDDFLEIMISHYGSWNVAFRQPRRPPESVVLPAGMWEDLHRDAAEFLASQAWYDRHGIPHRRGYLLHGPPGSGKTSLVKALASSLGLNIAVLSLNRADIDDETLLSLLSDLQKRRVILLLEDIDAIFSQRSRSADANRSGVTFSGLLNALDGVGSAQRLIVVMTTNHPDKLDPALIRAGRADRHFELPAASPDVAERLFRAMLPDHAGLLPRFLAAFANGSATTADLQGVFLKHRARPEGMFADPEALRVLGGPRPGEAAAAAEAKPERAEPEGRSLQSAG